MQCTGRDSDEKEVGPTVMSHKDFQPDKESAYTAEKTKGWGHFLMRPVIAVHGAVCISSTQTQQLKVSQDSVWFGQSPVLF